MLRIIQGRGLRMTDFNQQPPVEAPPTDEARQGLAGRIVNLLRNGYETVSRDIGTRVALGATIFAVASAAELVLNAEPVSGEGDVPARVSTQEPFAIQEPFAAEATQSSAVQHRHSSLKPQTVLNKIHRILHRYSIDTLSAHKGGDNICDLRGIIPGVPPYPRCKHAVATLTSAFLTPSSGGFKTKCDNPAASTYHSYDIYTYGQKYHTCGPGPCPGGLGNGCQQQIKPDEFQSKLNHQGMVIEDSVNLHFPPQTATRIGGNRKQTTATYECPTPATDPVAPETNTVIQGIRKIIIRRGRSAAVTTC